MPPAVISFAAKLRSGGNVKRADSSFNSRIADKFKPVCVNKLRSPILVLDFPRSGESSGGGLAPHHWHFSHPVFVMTGLRVTEVPFVKYRTIELFCFQGADFYRKSSEFRASEKIISLLGRHRKRAFCYPKKKSVKKFLENIVETTAELKYRRFVEQPTEVDNLQQ